MASARAPIRVAGLLAAVLAHRRNEFQAAVAGAPWWVLAASAAGVLMTATGTAGALGFAVWAGLDGIWARIRSHTPTTADAAV